MANTPKPEKKHVYPVYENGTRVSVPEAPHLGVGTIIGRYEGDPALMRVDFDNGYKALVLASEMVVIEEEKSL
jgi:hypothetical protein